MRAFDFSPLFRSTVGFDRLFDLADTVSQQEATYPPYNIERTDETHYRITVAVAGFAEKDLNAEVREGVLTVSGKRAEEAPRTGTLYRGIAGRSFERRFQLAEYVEVRGAALETACSTSSLSASYPKRRSPAASPSMAAKSRPFRPKRPDYA